MNLLWIYQKQMKQDWSFFNPKRGIEVVMDVNSAFPLPNNNYYKEEYSKYHFMQLLFDESISTELVYYSIENGKDKLPYFNEISGVLLLADIDFILRFTKRNNYYPSPNISFTGKR